MMECGRMPGMADFVALRQNSFVLCKEKVLLHQIWSFKARSTKYIPKIQIGTELLLIPTSVSTLNPTNNRSIQTFHYPLKSSKETLLKTKWIEQEEITIRISKMCKTDKTNFRPLFWSIWIWTLRGWASWIALEAANSSCSGRWRGSAPAASPAAGGRQRFAAGSGMQAARPRGRPAAAAQHTASPVVEEVYGQWEFTRTCCCRACWNGTEMARNRASRNGSDETCRNMQSYAENMKL